MQEDFYQRKFICKGWLVVHRKSTSFSTQLLVSLTSSSQVKASISGTGNIKPTQSMSIPAQRLLIKGSEVGIYGAPGITKEEIRSHYVLGVMLV